jgi:hypothetical protein
MYHSTWDLEVHAREMQRRRFREADRARQIEVARQCPDRIRMQGTRFSFSRLMTAVRNCFWSQPIPVDGGGSPTLVEARLQPVPANEPQVATNSRPGELSQPYAGMMVLARGTSAATTAQPCAAGDC